MDKKKLIKRIRFELPELQIYSNWDFDKRKKKPREWDGDKW